MLIYSTTTGQPTFDPQAYAEVTPEPFNEHALCVHSIGYCDAAWD